MKLSGEVYSERLKTFSDATMQLFSDTMSTSRENCYKAIKIVSDSELTEEQIVQKLTELKNSQA